MLLFHVERDEGMSISSRGCEGRGLGWAGLGNTPTLCGFVVQNQPEPPHVPRGSGLGLGCTV